ncbi:hypothetical protein GH714_015498 [Hevea brasiliensis]|uniref:Rad21/Rec8-like protein N-terminal domain-containing protein n=1 Tax=Hevea brasiliensis TaxID=3981 RepID=A0A6A6N492_HEVBR|nr:hypothetical protein GH714_015498 [Hevea brasiliensis]
MSGHLLLGVVRIYSKKVDYLYHDCNVILIGLSKAFTSTEVNLPENATTAKFESVTLPQTFDLDALDVDLDIYPDGSPDNHVRSQEEITLQDQIPTGRDPYVVVNFDEDIMMDTLPPEQDIDSGVRPMDKDDMGSPHASPINQMQVPTETVDLQDPGPSNQTEEPMDTVDIQQPGLSNQTELQTETLDFQAPGPSNQTELQTDTLDTQDRGYQNDASEPKKSLGQGLDQKEIPSPFKEDALLSGGRSSPFLQCPEPFNSAASQEAPEVFDTRIPFGNTSPELALRSTPPVQQPRPRPRKRKHFFDEATVLTNKYGFSLDTFRDLVSLGSGH